MQTVIYKCVCGIRNGLNRLRTAFWNIEFVRKAEAQRVFDTVSEHLFVQGSPAMNGTNCRYRDREGRKCAAGALIPDAMYSRAMEGYCVVGLIDNSSAKCSFSDYHVPAKILRHPKLVRSLQEVHDSAASAKYDGDSTNAWLSTASMQARLAAVAEKYGLSMNYAGHFSFADR